MSDITEKLDRALAHTRKAMNEIDEIVSISFSEPHTFPFEFEPLDEIYSAYEHAEKKILELKA